MYCTKKDDYDNYHKNHNIINIFDLIPSSKDIDDIKNKIYEREKEYEQLIEGLNKWKIKIINEIEKLKKNFKNEIELLKKMFFNFNIHFINYTYFKNFNYFKDYLNN